MKSAKRGKPLELIYNCDICHIMCPSKKYLEKHWPTHSAEYENSNLGESEDLWRFKGVATVKKGFKCELCEFVTHKETILKQHIDGVHKKIRNHKCQFCDKTFFKKGNLDQHLNSKHILTKDFACNQCNYVTHSKVHLTNHMKSKHSEEKEFKCELCDYETHSNYMLRLHSEKHSTVKNKKCRFCDFTTHSTASLTHHIKTQHRSHEFKLKCPECWFRTNYQDTLERHIARLHYQTFKCDYCDMEHYDRSLVRKHMKKKHPDKKVLPDGKLTEQDFDPSKPSPEKVVKKHPKIVTMPKTLPAVTLGKPENLQRNLPAVPAINLSSRPDIRICHKDLTVTLSKPAVTLSKPEIPISKLVNEAVPATLSKLENDDAVPGTAARPTNLVEIESKDGKKTFLQITEEVDPSTDPGISFVRLDAVTQPETSKADPSTDPGISFVRLDAVTQPETSKADPSIDPGISFVRLDSNTQAVSRPETSTSFEADPATDTGISFVRLDSNTQAVTSTSYEADPSADPGISFVRLDTNSQAVTEPETDLLVAKSEISVVKHAIEPDPLNTSSKTLSGVKPGVKIVKVGTGKKQVISLRTNFQCDTDTTTPGSGVTRVKLTEPDTHIGQELMQIAQDTNDELDSGVTVVKLDNQPMSLSGPDTNMVQESINTFQIAQDTSNNEFVVQLGNEPMAVTESDTNAFVQESILDFEQVMIKTESLTEQDPSWREEEYKCQICGYKTNQKRIYQRHIECHNDTESVKCKHCHFVTHSSNSLSHHVKTNHASYQFRCKFCSKFRTNIKESLEKHEAIQHVHLRCQICDDFSTRDRLHFKRHMGEKHKIKTFQFKNVTGRSEIINTAKPDKNDARRLTFNLNKTDSEIINATKPEIELDSDSDPEYETITVSIN